MTELNTEGIVTVGEVTTRTMREAITEPDYRAFGRASATRELEKTILWVQERLAASGPYDDTRNLQELLIWLGDRIREINGPATTEE